MIGRILISVLVCSLIMFPLIDLKHSNVLAAQGSRTEDYIIVLKDNVGDTSIVSKELSSKYGITSIDVYEHAIKGLSAKIPEKKIDAVSKDPKVEFIEHDYFVTANQVSQILPSGVNRIDADLSEKARIDNTDDRIDAGIAIIDTGIDLDHPDLNVVSGVSFVKNAKTADDDNGHGTHVAGVAAAIDNDFGVVGVAPGARLYAVKVLDSTGLGTVSQVVKGLDWVVKNSDTVDVANLSLNCMCHSKTMHKAVQKAAMEGIVIVVAAGNNSSDASNFEPAAYSEVIAVSAIIDTDGRCGGIGPLSDFGNDDSVYPFNNFGSAVDIAAPGVGILSTFKDGGYSVLSGTSMASPHVAGAVALYLDGNQRDLNRDGQINSEDLTVIRQAILSSAITQETTCDVSFDNGNGGFSGDDDSFPEPLIYSKEL